MFRPLLLLTFATSILPVSFALAEGRHYELSDFTEISIQEGISLEIKSGEFAVDATAIRGDLNRLSIEKLDDKLVISRTPNDPVDQFQVVIAMPKLEALNASSGSSVVSSATLSPSFELETSSGSSVSMKGNDLDKFSLVASSGSQIAFDGNITQVDANLSSGSGFELSGQCDVLQADIQSGASLQAGKMVCKSIDLGTASGSSAGIHASEAVDLTAQSGSSIQVSGDPETRKVNEKIGASISFN